MSVGSATRLRTEGLALLPQFCFGGLRLTSMDEHAGVAWVVARARAGSPAVVVTSHIHHVRMASNDAEFRRVVERSELNLADGWPLVAASRLLRPRLPGRVIGIDLVDRVLGAGQRFNLAILGGPPGGADALAERERERHNIVLVEPLPMGIWEDEREHDEMLARVAQARPNLVLVGLGAPRQELLADALRPYINGPVLCCGNSIAVLAGTCRRAPAVARRFGLEWLFRLFQSPRRLGPRYLAGAAWFVWIAVCETADRIRGSGHAPRRLGR
jgi:N-acetylglucosaminyldiphosphoundecaprenol N-acetyl-beta-D-mannosaminyltransferase